MPRTCVRVPVPGGGVALVTMSAQGNPNAPCAFCLDERPAKHEKLCDFPTRTKKQTRRCSKRLCAACTTALGDELDLCPTHAEIVDTHQIGERLEPLLRADDPRSRDVACDLIETATAGLPVAPALTLAPPKTYVQWRELVLERSAVFEYESGISRPLADRKAKAVVGERPKAMGAVAR